MPETKNEIEELRKKLEEIQAPVNVDDLTDESLSEVFESEMPEDIKQKSLESRNLEKMLEERRSGKADKNGELPFVIRDVWQRQDLIKKMNAIKAEIDTFKEGWLAEKKETVRAEREQEKENAKADFIKELQEKQEGIKDSQKEIAEKIEGKEAEIAEISNKINQGNRRLESIRNRVNTKTSASAYKSVKNRENAYLKQIEDINAQIKDLRLESADLEQSLNEIDSILYKIDGRKEKEEALIKEQEDKMWEDLKFEDSRLEANKDSVIENAFIAKQLEEDEEERKINEATAEEMKYAETVENEDYLNLDSSINSTEQEKAAEPEKKDEQVEQSKPVQQAEPVARRKPQQPSKQGEEQTSAKVEENSEKQETKPNSNEAKLDWKNYQLVDVGFYINDENSPIYYAFLLDEQGNEVKYESEKPGYDNIVLMDENKKAELEGKCIAKPEKSYDIGMEKFLEELDKKTGRTGREVRTANGIEIECIDKKAYIKMMEDKSLKTGKSDLPFNVVYDFSDLYKQPTADAECDKLDYIKKLAKENKKLGLATYRKEPNIFKKIWKAIKGIKTKLLPAPSEQPKGIKLEPNEKISENDIALMKMNESLEDRAILEDIQKVQGEEGFDLDAAQEQVEEADRSASEKAATLDRIKKFKEQYQVDSVQVEQSEPIVEEGEKEIDPDDRTMEHE